MIIMVTIIIIINNNNNNNNNNYYNNNNNKYAHECDLGINCKSVITASRVQLIPKIARTMACCYKLIICLCQSENF